MIKLIYKCLNSIKESIQKLYCSLLIKYFRIDVKGKININGIPYIRLYLPGKIVLENGVKLNSGIQANVIGGDEKLKLFVNGELVIGEETGISNSTIVCMNKITIGKRVFIGGGAKIYDTDFHPIHYLDRRENPNNIKTAPIFIDDDVFIGAHTIILKGTKIGKGSVIGAGSVVAKDIPPNQIWAGNPARFIRNLD